MIDFALRVINWTTNNYIELTASILGLLYIYFSIKQNVLLWLFGILTSALYIYVYFDSKFYADMSLQFYYLFISIYGWYYWINGKSDNKTELKVTYTDKNTALMLFAVTLAIFFVYAIVLKLTDSTIIYWDSFTTAAGITATWMLVKKKIEQWIIWIIVDAVSAVMYFHKELYSTLVLFVIYTVLAVAGYYRWRNEYKLEKIAVK